MPSLLKIVSFFYHSNTLYIDNMVSDTNFSVLRVDKNTIKHKIKFTRFDENPLFSKRLIYATYRKNRSQSYR